MAGMAGRKKEMENELDVLNKSLKPHNKQVTTIENFIGSPDTISASTKPDIFKVLKDLYTLAKRGTEPSPNLHEVYPAWFQREVRREYYLFC